MKQRSYSLFFLILCLSCSDQIDTTQKECEEYPCSKGEGCYEIMGKKYNLENSCFEGVKKISCLEKTSLASLDGDAYPFMRKTKESEECWLFVDGWVPEGNDWSNEVTASCYHADLYLNKPCISN